MRFRALPFDDPVVTDLIERVQQEYVLRYGGPDATPVGYGPYREEPDARYFGKQVKLA